MTLPQSHHSFRQSHGIPPRVKHSSLLRDAFLDSGVPVREVLHKADGPALARSFSPDLTCNSPVSASDEHALADQLERRPCHQPRYRSVLPSQNLAPRPWKQPGRSFGQMSGAPVQTASKPFALPMPSLMSVFGDDANTNRAPTFPDHHATASAHGDSLKRPASSGISFHPQPAHHNNPFTLFHQHRDSTSTSTSESTNSSPTTTISTIDSASMTDPSPATSPESPVARMSPSSFVPDFRSRNPDRSRADGAAPFFELQRPTTPAKKARNLKNLAVNTSNTLSLGRAVSTASLPMLVSHNEESKKNGPPSPAFVKPPTPPRRRPSNLGLTIQTPANSQFPMKLTIPPTPSFKRPNMLRHFQSSPSLPSLVSPTVAPEGGMQFPPPRPQRPAPRGFAEIPQEEEEEEDDQEPNFDVPQSREEKPAAYPNGPICIYESGIYLYFEPTAEQAANFDVVVNVASEVKNPFNAFLGAFEPMRKAEKNVSAGSGGSQETIVPARSRPAESAAQDSPSTPKAGPGKTLRAFELPNPEYIHYPWEHNTDIVPDLHKLVKVIDDRVQKGKRVLVHCQCGVSRSASLIVAYGIYKNPGMSVQEAYDAVKKRSKWIGPNMSLIMQLQEFRTGLLKATGAKAFGDTSYTLGLPRKLGSNLPSGCAARSRSPFDVNSSAGSRTPRTAPLPPETDQPQRASTGSMMAISPGPLSAPSGLYRRSWDSAQTAGELTPPPVSINMETQYVDPKGHIVPPAALEASAQSFPRRNDSAQADAALRPSIPNFSRQLPLRQDRDKDNDHYMSGTETDSVFSPRSAEFHMAGLKHDEDSDPYGLLSPQRSEFPKDIFTKAPEHSRNVSLGPLSPRATGFHLAPLKPQEEPGNRSGLLLPTAGGFPSDALKPLPVQPAPPVRPVVSDPVFSPRSEEFHMAPIKAEETSDPFGIMSPVKADFPTNPFDGLDFFGRANAESELRGSFPHRQPHSLSKTTPLPQGEFLPSPDPGMETSFGGPNTDTPMKENPNSGPVIAQSKAPIARNIQLVTPPRPRTLRTKYSAPSISSQIRLHTLQSEIESHLPHRSPNLGPQADDLEALQSPRATELTMNPFHIDFTSLANNTRGQEATPVPGSQPVFKRPEKADPWLTPKAVEKDPRSPPLKGVSPITRNIWDVL